MIAPSEPTRITVHRASRPSLASTPPKKTTTSPGKMNPANTDASAAGSRKINTSASHGGKPSTCSMSQLTIDTTKALRRLNPSNDGVPAVGASPGAARNAGPGAAALGRHGAGRARADRADRRGRDDGHRAGGRLGDGSVLSLIHISEPTRLLSISYAVFCLKKKKGEVEHAKAK